MSFSAHLAVARQPAEDQTQSPFGVNGRLSPSTRPPTQVGSSHRKLTTLRLLRLEVVVLPCAVVCKTMSTARRPIRRSCQILVLLLSGPHGVDNGDDLLSWKKPAKFCPV